MVLSVIVPVYNVEFYIRDCITSFINQSCKNFELILVDDGSTDHSGSICDEFSSSYDFINVYHKKNGGVSSARNLGISKAKGNYISFVDADDWVSSNYCEIITKLVSKDSVDLIFFQANHVFEDCSSSLLIPKTGLFSDKCGIEMEISYLIKNHFFYEFFGYTWNKVFKKELISEPFVNGLSFREDELFTLSYLRNVNTLLVTKDVLYNYRVINSGLTNKRNLRAYSFLADKETQFIDLYGELFGCVMQEKIISYYFESVINNWFSYSYVKQARKIMQVYSYYKPTGVKKVILNYTSVISYLISIPYFGFIKLKRLINGK